MTTDIVIARYKETNLDWLKQLDYNIFNLLVYDKSGKFDNLEVFSQIPRRYTLCYNEGGNEAHTYLYHIVNEYDNLADVTVFTQAWPFDHCKDFLDKIKEPCCNFTWLAHEMIRNEWDGSPHHGIDVFVEGKIEGLHPDWLYSAIFHSRPPDYFWFGQGGQHMVTKEQIHTKPKEFYQHIINLITGPFKQYKPFCALERFWSSIYLDPYY